MENHPIPQDVTGFQFKLIGDMTLKQFAYLATGTVLGWAAFVSPLFIIIKYPVALLCVGLGVGFAFIPVGGRPMDTMLYHFVLSLFLPNQFFYDKIGGLLVVPGHIKKHVQKKDVTLSHSQEELRVFLDTLPHEPHNKLDEKELTYFNSLASLFGGTAPAISQPQEQTVPVSQEQAAKNEPKEAASPQELAKEEEEVKKELEEAKAAEATQHDPTAAAQAHEKVVSLEDELSAIMREKAKLEEQLAQLAQKMAAQKTVEKIQAPKDASSLSQSRSIPQSMGVSAGIPIAPDFPNVVMGIVKDPRGNVLSNILVEITDTEGNPVRAFKTNNLGIFAAATPLQPGQYTILFEDPQGKQRFEPVPIVLTNDIFSPLEIISMDEREELRRDLFGATV